MPRKKSRHNCRLCFDVFPQQSPTPRWQNSLKHFPKKAWLPSYIILHQKVFENLSSTCYEGCCVWSQESHCARHFVDCAHPAHGVSRFGVLKKLLIGLIVHATALVNISYDHSRIDSIHWEKQVWKMGDTRPFSIFLRRPQQFKNYGNVDPNQWDLSNRYY